jgi:hypothetical protein
MRCDLPNNNVGLDTTAKEQSSTSIDFHLSVKMSLVDLILAYVALIGLMAHAQAVKYCGNMSQMLSCCCCFLLSKLITFSSSAPTKF